MSDSHPQPPSDPALDEFGERLAAKLDERARIEAELDRPGSGSAAGAAARMVSDLIAGVVVGAGLGWLIDEVFGTAPAALIICFLLGFGVGVSNVLRTARRLQHEGGAADRD